MRILILILGSVILGSCHSAETNVIIVDSTKVVKDTIPVIQSTVDKK